MWSRINLEMLSKFGDLTAYDDNKIVLKFIRKNFKQKNQIYTINDKKSNLIVAMDIIEHINDDKKLLKLNKKLLKNGKILITVPAIIFFTTKIKFYITRRYSKENILNILRPNLKKLNVLTIIFLNTTDYTSNFSIKYLI